MVHILSNAFELTKLIDSFTVGDLSPEGYVTDLGRSQLLEIGLDFQFEPTFKQEVLLTGLNCNKNNVSI